MIFPQSPNQFLNIDLNNHGEEDDDLLNLSLSTPNNSPREVNVPPPLSIQHQDNGLPSLSSLFPAMPPQPSASDLGPLPRRNVRRLGNQAVTPGKPATITPPYPWATAKRATVHSLRYLKAKGITTITGEVECKRCTKQYEIKYDLYEKLAELRAFILKNRDEMRHRAPEEWMNPTLPDCEFCHQNNCVKPIYSKKQSINWLFLLLGQMIGCRKLSELKYFCKHTNNHRTGAKDRVLYLTYFELCKQLLPR